ncbi:hypothetical protein [Stigmatella erecta]|uniref:Uncharacterized protein n=1 Tax=Stigmatella erecta TaxID=83460 RepID=A0A1I0J9Q9_9BACT|nr:hypothetical protein [Stigmatella erecta]SEU06722.1 hypothetical protein SAMN05443639_10787 [Stigmatella erecta]
MQAARQRVIPAGSGHGRKKGHKKRQTGIRLADDVEASLQEAKAAGHSITDALQEGFRVGRDAQKAMGADWGEVLARVYASGVGGKAAKSPGTILGELALAQLKAERAKK